MARQDDLDAETARVHAEWYAELNELFTSGAPAAPSNREVAPEGCPPFAFLIERQTRPAARADQLGITLNPPPAAPAPQPRGSSSQEELPYKGPPAEALPPPNLPANPLEK